ncbi:MAG: hypothetical protein QOE28_1610 [Solirubrobacteraceae bacterium]|nr:hypothetical protein [Solirubrobacteraceae bacterium]
MRARHERERDAEDVRTEAPIAQQQPPILDLQRTSGNAAVARMVQNLARDAKKAPAKPAHKKYSLTSQQEGWDRETLVGHGGDMYDQKAYDAAAALWERAYSIQKDRGLALNIYRCYKALSWDEEADHWLGVSQGRKPPEEAEPPVSYQQF